MENQAVGARTKHIDICMHHIWEMIQNNWLKVKFTPTEENLADLMTKNLVETVYANHKDNISQGRIWDIIIMLLNRRTPQSR